MGRTEDGEEVGARTLYELCTPYYSRMLSLNDLIQKIENDIVLISLI